MFKSSGEAEVLTIMSSTTLCKRPNPIVFYCTMYILQMSTNGAEWQDCLITQTCQNMVVPMIFLLSPNNQKSKIGFFLKGNISLNNT